MDKNPKISLIAAISKNRVLGKDGKIPWNIPGEQKRFKEITTPHPIIMGRKTFESIGRVLPNRTNIVISRNLASHPKGVIVVHSLDEAIEIAQKEDPQEIFVIGGGEIYQQAIPQAQKLYLTVIDQEMEGDTFFPDYSEFTKIIKQEQIESGEYRYTYFELEKPNE